MDLFCFASKNAENIRRGVEAKKWAVATVTPAAMRGRETKAKKYLDVGSRGILYCSPTQSFTVPFLVKSKANPLVVVKDIWPEAWVLPFDIEPLGAPGRQLHSRIATERWPILKRKMETHTNVPAAMNLTGTTVFVPVDISDQDWAAILSDLAD